MYPAGLRWKAADELNSEMPKHWEKVALNDVANLLTGFAFSSKYFSKTKGIPLIRIRDIEMGYSDTFYTGTYDDEYIVNKGDILIGMDGDFKYTIWNGEKGLLNQRVCKLIPFSKNIIHELYFYRLNDYLYAIQKATSSVTVTHIAPKDIINIKIPLPPLNEQKRIYTTLNSINRHLQKIKDNVIFIEKQIVTIENDNNISNLGILWKSILAKAFRGELVPQDPKDEPAGALLERIRKERGKLTKEISA